MTGGPARRLTDDEGQERHPKLSPDGTLIAFTGEVDGNPDVYVMRADGSGLRRLTFHPEADEVVGWHPTSAKILFRSGRSSWSRFDRLFLISPDGGGAEELPLHEAGRGCFSPDGTRIAYNQIATEDRTWKRYHGGMAQDIRLYDFATAEDRLLTDYTGADRLPMWIGDAIYFASDRSGTMNIHRLRRRDRRRSCRSPTTPTSTCSGRARAASASSTSSAAGCGCSTPRPARRPRSRSRSPPSRGRPAPT